MNGNRCVLTLYEQVFKISGRSVKTEVAGNSQLVHTCVMRRNASTETIKESRIDRQPATKITCVSCNYSVIIIIDFTIIVEPLKTFNIFHSFFF